MIRHLDPCLIPYVKMNLNQNMTIKHSDCNGWERKGFSRGRDLVFTSASAPHAWGPLLGRVRPGGSLSHHQAGGKMRAVDTGRGSDSVGDGNTQMTKGKDRSA